MLTVLVNTISNSLVFLYSHFSAKNIIVYAIFNNQSFNGTLTNIWAQYVSKRYFIFSMNCQRLFLGKKDYHHIIGFLSNVQVHGATSTPVGPLPDSWLAARMADLTRDLQVRLS